MRRQRGYFLLHELEPKFTQVGQDGSFLIDRVLHDDVECYAVGQSPFSFGVRGLTGDPVCGHEEQLVVIKLVYLAHFASSHKREVVPKSGASDSNHVGKFKRSSQWQGNSLMMQVEI